MSRTNRKTILRNISGSTGKSWPNGVKNIFHGSSSELSSYFPQLIHETTYDYNLKLILSACCSIVALPLELPFSVSVFKQPFININIKKYNCCH